jgi:hypothetical protein
VNLAAPPGTKRPRKRGRPSKADGESKRRGRPRKDDSVPVSVTSFEGTDNDAKEHDDDELEVEDSEVTTEKAGPSSPKDELESEEETMHSFERRTSLVRMQLSAYSSFSPSSAHPRYAGEEDSANTIERLDIEISTLRRQASDAIQVSMRLTDQLAQAQAEASRARSASKRLEVMLEEESRKRRDAEVALSEEKRKRFEAEEKLVTHQLSSHSPPR